MAPWAFLRSSLRRGGFTINTKSKSGTDEFHGSISYQIQTAGMTGDRETGSASEFKEDRDWTVASFSGPIAKDRLYFYGSYYAPTWQCTISGFSL